MVQRAVDFTEGLLDVLSCVIKDDSVIHLSMDDVSTSEYCGMSAVAGYVAADERWSKFNWHAIINLAQLKKPYLHTSHDLHNFGLLGHGLDDDAIWLILSPHINSIKQSLLDGGAFPLAVVTEHEAYESLTEKEKKFVRSPEVHSFEVACYRAFQLKGSRLRITNALSIQFDESQNAPILYEAYRRMKNSDPDMRDGLGAICFCDDRVHAPTQAADLFAHLLLRQWRASKAIKPDPKAYTELTEHSNIERIDYGPDRLKRLAQMRMQVGNKLAMDFS